MQGEVRISVDLHAQKKWEFLAGEMTRKKGKCVSGRVRHGAEIQDISMFRLRHGVQCRRSARTGETSRENVSCTQDRS